MHSLIIYGVHSIFLLSLLYASSLSFRKPPSLIDTSFQQSVYSCKEIKEGCCNCTTHHTITVTTCVSLSRILPVRLNRLEEKRPFYYFSVHFNGGLFVAFSSVDISFPVN